jgi:ELWxxDGT repeat protein
VPVAGIDADFLCSRAGGRTCYAAVGDVLFFGAQRGGPDDTYDLWKSDGTEVGTTLIAGLAVGGYPSDFTPLDETLVFTVDDLLWGSDGTATGTRPLTGPTPALDLTREEGAVFFSMGGTLWRSDGTPTGTFQVTPGPTGVRVLASHDGTVFFSAREPEGGLALWRSDGTAAGTARIYRLARSFLSLTPPAVVLNGGLVLPALEPVHGIELWKLPTGNYDTCSPDPPSPPGICLPPDDPCAEHPGTASPCDDGDPCTLDGCTPRDGCTHTPLADCVATTTTTSTTSTTSTTLTCSFDTVALCDDADPCTVDICEAGRCQHQLRSGLAGVRCRLRHRAPSLACEDQIPQRLQRRLERARRFVKRAADAGDQRNARRRGRQATRQLDAAGKLLAKSAQRGMASACADALERVLAEVGAGMKEWLATDRHAEDLAEPTPHQRVERDAHFRASSPARRTVSSDRREP